MKKLHLINNLVLALLILGFITCIVICYKFNLWEWANIWVSYLWGLFLFFSLFWIFMKWWEFSLSTEKIKND